ncbi:MAG: low specificity L-threonine aldolase [Bdellovibrionales bacterium]|nr:low specificity L-threonine aldolase [Oligoflexia bacterium]
MQTTKSFLSDNSSGAHPLIAQALIASNTGHVEAYGLDSYTRALEKRFAEHFGKNSKSFPVFSGTGANVLALASATRSFQAIVCSDMAHIDHSETGAPEKFTGCKLIGVPSINGKISPESITPFLSGRGSMHASQPSLISISQATEVGTVYTLKEIRALADFAHAQGMKLHMDGARISNAAVALSCSFSEMVRDCEVDILSFGGTKNGLFFGDAVTFLDPALADGFLYLRKHGLQLASKMRFISAQLLAFLENDLWKDLATHANARATQLKSGLEQINGVQIVYPVETNAVFVELPLRVVGPLQKEFPFHLWKGDNQARLMTSFDTRPEDVEDFLALARELIG